MAQRTEDKQDLLKQNFELTLIIIFIGLAFGLVGLIVQTAAVMSIVVISVGVIVGFVSYRDAFIPRPNGDEAVNTPVPQSRLALAQAAKPIAKPVPMAQQISSRPQQMEEPLPRLPKIHRLTTPEEPTFSSPTKPTIEAPLKVVMAPVTQRVSAPVQPAAQPVVQPAASTLGQDRLGKSRKPRARKTVDISSEEDQSKD